MLILTKPRQRYKIKSEGINVKFQFKVNLTDKDYLDFNVFCQTKSRYGKKTMLKVRILLSAITLIPIFISLLGGNFSLTDLKNSIPPLVFVVLIQLILTPLFKLILKLYVKTLSRTGKQLYPTFSVITFYEDSFTEETAEYKTETKYSGIERISVLVGKTIIIHINAVKAYILPAVSFNSVSQYNEFLDFIKTKCAAVDTYTAN